MSKNNLQILENIPRDETENDMDYRFYTKNEVLHVMSAAREEERAMLRKIVENMVTHMCGDHVDIAVKNGMLRELLKQIQ